MGSYILLMIMGAAVCLFVYSINNKYKKLSQNGEKVEGMLAGYEFIKIKNNNTKVPVASFVTKTGQSITQKSEESFFPSNARKGTKVIVYYNPDNPQEFMMQGKKFRMMFIVVMIGGTVFFLTGLFLLLNYLGIVHILKLQ